MPLNDKQPKHLANKATRKMIVFSTMKPFAIVLFLGNSIGSCTSMLTTKENIQPSMISSRGAEKTLKLPAATNNAPLQMLTASLREIAARAFSNAALVAGCPSEMCIYASPKELNVHDASAMN